MEEARLKALKTEINRTNNRGTDFHHSHEARAIMHELITALEKEKTNATNEHPRSLESGRRGNGD